jgi:hypothetical protein
VCIFFVETKRKDIMLTRNWRIASVVILATAVGYVAYAMYLLIYSLRLEKALDWYRMVGPNGEAWAAWRVVGETRNREGPHPLGEYGRDNWGNPDLWYDPADPSVAVRICQGTPYDSTGLMMLCVALPIAIGYGVALARTWAHGDPGPRQLVFSPILENPVPIHRSDSQIYL